MIGHEPPPTATPLQTESGRTAPGSINVSQVLLADERLLHRLNSLIRQLSNSAPPLTLPALQHLIGAGGSSLFIATDKDEVVGTVCLVVFHSPTGTRAFIEDVVVDQAARRRGIAEALVRTALSHARRQGARTVDLTCRPERLAATRLYQKLGFKVRATNFYRLDCS